MLRKIFLAFALAAFVTPASAVTYCAPSASIHSALTEMLGAKRVVQASAEPDDFYEVWANTETGLWAIVYVSDSDVSCLVASGEGVHVSAPPPVENKDSVLIFPQPR